MIPLSAERIAEMAGAVLAGRGADGGPKRTVIDSREAGAGDLFVGLAGEHADGAEFAAAALDAGAWGALVDRRHAAGLEGRAAWVLGAEDPLAALQSLAHGWRRELGVEVVGITGSTGKTSVKDICASLLGEHVHASPENYNTEIGLPLTILSAPADVELLVLEMAMRGPGQIAELCAIAEPGVAVITNIGPVHLELLGTVEAIGEAKAEIIAGLRKGGTVVVPADADSMKPHIAKAGASAITFGPGGDVSVAESTVAGGETDALISTPDGEERFRLPFDEAYNLTNALAAVAAGVALGLPLSEMSGRAAQVTFSRLRGELVELDDGIALINDSYNANPMSMRAALDHLASIGAKRTVAVLGEMGELGPDAERFHREVGEYARRTGVGLLIGVGEPAGAYEPDEQVGDPDAAAARLRELVEPGDTVLVKGSRSAGLERIAETLV